MTTRTREITAEVKSVQSAIGDAVTGAGQLLEAAREKVDTALAHGWHGVAANMEAAAEHTEAVIEQLDTASQATAPVTESLDEITDQTSSPEVSARLTSAANELEIVDSALGASLSSVDEAIAACRQAGQESLPVSLYGLHLQIEKIQERVTQLSSDIAEEGSHALTWTADASPPTGETAAGDPAGKPLRVMTPPRHHPLSLPSPWRQSRLTDSCPIGYRQPVVPCRPVGPEALPAASRSTRRGAPWAMSRSCRAPTSAASRV